MSIFVFLLILTLQTVSICNGHPSNVRHHLDPPASISDRVIGGHRVRIDQVPYHVLIRQHVSPNTYFQCGAVLLDTDWILTASHCTANIDASSGQAKTIEAFFGMSHLSQLPPVHLSVRSVDALLPLQKLITSARSYLPEKGLFVLRFPPFLNEVSLVHQIKQSKFVQAKIYIYNTNFHQFRHYYCAIQICCK